ncbi:MAG: TlpA family protein disulfide reductase [Candidatus Cloacimonetes bacterium]|nr:TlpA family protein disulfide reductase [Candidatus Cloacimonadota bacterium]
MLKKALSGFLLLCLASLSFAGIAELESALLWAQNADEAMDAILLNRDDLQNLDELRLLQNYWLQIQPQSCRDWFEAKHQAQPQNPELEYLWLRSLADLGQQISKARHLIRKQPKFYWGYRLFANTYSQILLDTLTDVDLRENVISNLDSDRGILEQGLTIWSGDDYLHLALFHHQAALGKDELAEMQLLALSDPTVIETNFHHVFEFIEATGRLQAFEKLFPTAVSLAISKGEVAASDSLAYYQFYWLEALKKAQAWDRMKAYLDIWPQLKANPEHLRTRILMHLGLNEKTEALTLLEQALTQGIIIYPEAASDKAYSALQNLPDFAMLMIAAKEDWDAKKPQRREKVLKDRTAIPLPFEYLSKPDGSPLHPNDFQGKLLILDFWARWCEPCLQSLARLQNWSKDKEDVSLISVNVWESPLDRPEIIEFIQKQGLGTELLFGEGDVSQIWGFGAIPWICAIDADGRIAFSLSGNSPVLEETLDFWLEALREEM